MLRRLMMRGATPPTADEVAKAIDRARPGDTIVYYIGDLLNDRNYGAGKRAGLPAMADLVAAAASPVYTPMGCVAGNGGAGFLTQHKLADSVYEYRFTKKGNGQDARRR